jgi:dsRNA-specific ribonuclease
MNNGQWSTDALAEMFEGVVGALLLDSDYTTVQQLLSPWVAESFAAARAAGSSAKVAAAAAAVTRDSAVSQQQQQQHVQGSSLVCAASSSDSLAQHHLATLLQEQLLQQCSYRFQDVSLVSSCSEHVLQLLHNGSSNPQADKWHFIGFSLLQFAAAQHAYVEQCQQLPSSSMWQQLPWQQQGHAVAAAADDDFDFSDSSTSSQGSSLCSAWSSNVASCDDDAFTTTTSSSSSASSSSCSSSSVNEVHLMSKQMVKLTNIRHRCVISSSG